MNASAKGLDLEIRGWRARGYYPNIGVKTRLNTVNQTPTSPESVLKVCVLLPRPCTTTAGGQPRHSPPPPPPPWPPPHPQPSSAAPAPAWRGSHSSPAQGGHISNLCLQCTTPETGTRITLPVWRQTPSSLTQQDSFYLHIFCLNKIL